MKNKSVKEKEGEERSEQFPGYPHYPSKDDILNNEKRIDKNISPESIQNKKQAEDATEIPPTEDIADGIPDPSRVTHDDLAVLGDDNLAMDGGDDEMLRGRQHAFDMTDYGLDVPGAELDDVNEATGNEDEENNSYSLGGDNHD